MGHRFYCTNASHNRTCCYECKRDELTALRARTRELEAAIEREAQGYDRWAKLARNAGDVDCEMANRDKAARLRALLNEEKTP